MDGASAPSLWQAPSAAPARPEGRLRILFVRNLYLPQDLGGNRYPLEVTTRLARRGHELTVVASRSPHVAPHRPELGWMQHRRYPALRRHPLLTHLSHALGAAAALAGLRAEAFDVLVASSYDVALGARAVPELRRLPMVFIYHSEFYSVWAEQMRRAEGRLSPARLAGRAIGSYMRWVERRVFHASASIVAVSEFSRRQVEARAPEVGPRVRVIPTGVDTRQFSPAQDQARAKVALGLDPARPLLLGVGRLTPVKRFDLLVRAAGELQRQGRAVQLAVVGDGPEAARLRALAGEQGLAGHARLPGYLDAAGVREYMRAADLQVCASEFENHSLAILEAIACGTPVLGTRAGGTPEILEQLHPLLLLPPSPDPSAIALAAARFLDDPPALESLRRRSRELATERYDWESVVSSLERHLASVANITPGGRAQLPTAEGEQP